MPNGRIVIYTTGNRILAYDPATKQSTLIVTGFDGELSISPAGDRIAYSRLSDEENTDRIWSVPIDPTTGAATGPGQRISLSFGDTPSFSPDGKIVAFAKYTGKGNALAVVASTGGPERIAASFPAGIFSISWSRDGKWIFPEVSGAGSVLRVPVEGGTPEPVFPVARRVGLVEGTLALYGPDEDAQRAGRLAYAAVSGARGEFRVPPGARWRGDFVGVKSTSILLTAVTRPEWAHILSWADGKVRVLRPESPKSRGPAWSPDGRRIAMHDSTDAGWGITVMNADGSGARHYPVKAFPIFMRWSPKGELLGYGLEPRPAGPREIGILDLRSGKTQIVSSSPGASALDFRWKPDGGSVVVFKTFPAIGDKPPVRQVFQAPLAGSERMLRDLSGEFPELTRGGLISADLLALGNGPNLERFLVPTAGGAPIKLPRGGNWVQEPGVSPNGNWLAALSRGSDGRITSIDLVAARGDSIRTLQLPFAVDNATFRPPFSPDGRHLVLFGKRPGEDVSKVYSVPLDGSAPRVLATLPTTNTIAGRLDLSPDGMSVVFTSLGLPTGKIYELDLTPILQVIGKQ